VRRWRAEVSCLRPGTLGLRAVRFILPILLIVSQQFQIKSGGEPSFQSRHNHQLLKDKPFFNGFVQTIPTVSS
jgi:hypothetical protein